MRDGLAEPPEGALAGENVPHENQTDAIDEAKIERTMNLLKTHAKVFRDMNERERRERAIEYIRKYGTGGGI